MSQPSQTLRPALSEGIEGLKREVRLYSDAIALYASIYLHFQRHQVTVHVEPTVKIKGKDRSKVPDLLVEGLTGWAILEHKGSLPMDQKLLAAELETINEYNQEIAFNESVFQPEVALLCPHKLTSDLMSKKDKFKLPTIVSYSPPTEKTCTLAVENGTLKGEKVSGLFSDENGHLNMDIDITERWKYKFVRREPPIPYTTHFVWGFISLSKDAFQKEVTVQYNKLVEQINNVCPPWCAEAKQLSEGRLNKAIDFLRLLGWIKYQSKSGEITAHTTRGTRVGRMEEYLCEKFVKYYGLAPEPEEEPRMRKRAPTLEEFFQRQPD